MDFIEKLPMSKGKDTIWAIVDRFTKYSHFISLSHPLTASDKIFTSVFWKELFSSLGWYNTSYHSAIKMSPFQALYGYQPPQVGYGPWLEIKTAGVEQWLIDHTKMIQHLKSLLQKARDRMKMQADKHRSEREFAVGDWVFLKLKLYKQLSLKKSPIWKLMPKFCGPFEILKRIGEGAYCWLKLPEAAKVHPVFHVSLLKKQVGHQDRVVSELPPMTESGELLLTPVKLLARRMVKRNNAAIGQMLIQWAHLPEEEATWEDNEEILRKFPSFQP
ncbi:hypothetical protein ABFS83_07G086400 [Erythranthe nasuta]